MTSTDLSLANTQRLTEWTFNSEKSGTQRRPLFFVLQLRRANKNSTAIPVDDIVPDQLQVLAKTDAGLESLAAENFAHGLLGLVLNSRWPLVTIFMTRR